MIYPLESIINTLTFYKLMHRKTPSFSIQRAMFTQCPGSPPRPGNPALTLPVYRGRGLLLRLGTGMPCFSLPVAGLRSRSVSVAGGRVHTVLGDLPLPIFNRLDRLICRFFPLAGGGVQASSSAHGLVWPAAIGSGRDAEKLGDLVCLPGFG